MDAAPTAHISAPAKKLPGRWLWRFPLHAVSASEALRSDRPHPAARMVSLLCTWMPTFCLPNHAQRSIVLQGPRVGSHRRRDCVRMAQTGLGDAIWHPQRDVPSLVGGSHAGRAQNPTKFGRGRTCSTLQSQGLWHLTLPQSFRFAGDQASTVSSHVRLNTTVSVAWRPNQAAGNVMVSDVTGA
jgi:hypothetical protein